jgi:FlaA1/EpsC-like NDP-sugar epimerase
MIDVLLGRRQHKLDPEPIRKMLAGAVVMVTGAGGSIGSELCRQCCKIGAATIIAVDHSEYALYKIHQELERDYPDVRTIPDLQNLSFIRYTVDQYKPEVIFHAAAYKHVPMVEANPLKAAYANITGFMDVLKCPGGHRVILISSDKAVRPTSVMGATKRVCELLLKRTRRPASGAVRFGNVFGSSGSVVPLWEQQIAEGGPVTVTHPDITRYFMAIPEAVSLVLAAGTMAKDGNIYILDMGEPLRLADMARQMIYAQGKSEIDCPVMFTGLRAGEKLYEELIRPHEQTSQVGPITVVSGDDTQTQGIDDRVSVLMAACANNDEKSFRYTLKDIVPDWTMP